jgi:fido (protein-threonine AMPylation protein)
MIDPYLYPDTEILINKFNIQDAEKLAEIEANYTALRMDESVASSIGDKFDSEHLATIHKFIFQDIFNWAGKFRTINIFREELVLGGLSIEYADCTEIKRRLDRELKALNSVDWPKLNKQRCAKKLSRHFASIWQIHPFREGNTRTVTTFICNFATHKGLELKTEMFKDNAEYLRLALVAATAIFDDIGDRRKFEYLDKIISGVLV